MVNRRRKKGAAALAGFDKSHGLMTTAAGCGLEKFLPYRYRYCSTTTYSKYVPAIKSGKIFEAHMPAIKSGEALKYCRN
jgi:hypothetical protein